MMKTANEAQIGTQQGSHEEDYWVLSEGALSERMLSHDERAWREFLRRFNPVLRHQIGKVIGRARRTLLANDVIDDILGDLYVDLLERDMRKVRIWVEGPRKARFASWLGMIASQVAIDHIRRAASDAGLSPRFRRAFPNRETDPNRGGEWLGAERSAELGLLAKEGV